MRAAIEKKKDFDKDIMDPIKVMGRLTGKGTRYSRVKCTTQFIVGASDETDSKIVSSMYGLYGRLNFKRVYFSAYQNGLGDVTIPGEANLPGGANPFVREHRLYQVDFLTRVYGFRREDILFNGEGNLSVDKDPKQVWADNHPEFYPVKINRSDRETLLKVPGLGPETVRRIVRMRGEHRIHRLEDLGLRGKRLEKIRHYCIPE